MQAKRKNLSHIIEPCYFSNWGDRWYPRLANVVLLPASRITSLTPNMVTITSFVLYVTASLFIARGGDATLLGALLLPVAYVLDCLDGQLARYTRQTSTIGDYLDKTLDVLKIGIINAAFSVAAYRLTSDVLYVCLGFLSCFGFMFRYYIKLETMFIAINKDNTYLEKSRVKRQQLYAELELKCVATKSIKEQVLWLWFRHHAIFALDEAEHVTFGALAAAMHRPDLWLWVFGVGQITIALVRLVQRGKQLATNATSLTYPMRK